MPKDGPKKIEFFNKKARFNYAIEDSFEAGIVLFGSEIKAVRLGRVNITSAHAKILNDELFLLGSIIETGDDTKDRTRKLLVKKDEIKKLTGKVQEKGLTLVPLKMYMTRGKLKVEIGIGRGKKKFDKRETIKKREFERKLSSDYSIKKIIAK